MLNEVCGYLKNWFEKEQIFDTFTITDNAIARSDGSTLSFTGCNYFRIAGDKPTINDGVYPVSEYVLENDTFKGAVWLMAVPSDLIELCNNISDWEEKYGGVDSQALSPYTSESFGGYSYSKSAGSEDGGGSGWQAAFKSKLSRYRKI